MHRKTYTDLLFVLILGNCCITLILFLGSQVPQSAGVLVPTIRIALNDYQTLTSDKLYNRFSNKWQRIKTGPISVWQSLKHPSHKLFQSTGPGMWSEITLSFIIDTNESRIINLKVARQKETAGVGSRIAERHFVEQFSDMVVTDQVKMVNYSTAPGHFDGITGATVSSKAIETIINNSLKELKQ